MIFISLGKFRVKPTKQVTSEVSKLMEKIEEDGVKFVDFYWTLGRYDTVAIMEAPDEKTVLKANLMVSGIISTETMVALNRGEAHELVE